MDAVFDEILEQIRRRYCVLLILACFCLFPIAVFAGEIKVRDAMGLTRALRFVNGNATVEVRIKEPAGIELHLSNVDGLAPDIQPLKMNEITFIFRGVSDGTWKLTSVPNSAIFTEVKIVE